MSSSPARPTTERVAISSNGRVGADASRARSGGYLGAIGPRHADAARRFGAFGDGSVICFPPTALVNERYIHIGAGTRDRAARVAVGGDGAGPAVASPTPSCASATAA